MVFFVVNAIFNKKARQLESDFLIKNGIIIV